MQRTQSPLATLLLLALPGLAGAQTVLFEDDFSTGIDGWDLTSQDGIDFHLYEPADPCASAVTPFPSGDRAVRAGVVGECDFDTWDQGHWWPRCTMTTKAPIDLPSSANETWLTFWSYDDVECHKCGWDWRFVWVSDDGGATWDFVGESDMAYQWYTKALDLTPWNGRSVLLRFDFDAVDQWGNSGLGWVIDDVRVVADPWVAPLAYCDAAPNSSGSAASIGHSGSTSVAANDFVLEMDSAPAKQFAHFFYGSGSTYQPVGDGFLCVGPGATGFARLLPSSKIDTSGALSVPLDIPGSLAGNCWITPGATYRFQCWFRDPQGGPSGSNFSNGLQVLFRP